MRKNIKTCICVVTTILPIILSACSNKADDTNTLKTEKKNTTTFVNDTSSDITDTTEKITTVETTEEDTTELISVTEQDTSEDVTKQQQTTIITSVNSTPVPVQTTPRLTETTPPRPTETDQTTTPVMITPEYPEYPEYPPELYKIKEVIGLGEKYSYNGIEFKISGLCFYNDSHSYCSLNISIINKNILDDPKSYDETGLYGSKLYTKYEVYDSEGICVKTDFCENDIRSIMNGFGYLINIDISDLPSTGYTIKLLNYE